MTTPNYREQARDILVACRMVLERGGSPELVLAEWASRIAEEVGKRRAACTDCGGAYTLADLDEAGVCSECRERAAAAEETPAERAARNAAIDAMFCKEPGCARFHDPDVPHGALISLGDIDFIEWTKPGAYLDAIRPLARGARVSGGEPSDG